MKLIVVTVAILFGLLFSAISFKKERLFKSSLLKDFVEIKEGNVVLDSVLYEVQGFYISKFEVSNEKYKEFLGDLKARNENEMLEKADIQSANWNALYVDWDIDKKYHSHAGFTDFPVVNISYQGAQRYCQWLTEKVSQEVPDEYLVEITLPSRKQWVRAARGETQQVYSWRHPYLRNAQGKMLCNFKRLGAERIHFNKQKNEYEIVEAYRGPAVFITSKVDEYEPNAFGVYNTCGNVAEMIAEEGEAVGGNFTSPGYDVRVESIEQYSEAAPYIGFRPVMNISRK